MSYTFLDATGVTQTAGSSVVGGVNYPVVIVPGIALNSSNASVIATGTIGASVIGTVPVTQAGVWKTSVLAFQRNDTLASIVGTDLDFYAQAVGPSGEGIVANAPFTKWIQGNASVFTGTSVQAIAPQGTSIFSYITGLQVANASANNVYLTFTGGLGGVSSILGYLPAPANSGAIPLMTNGWKTGANSGISVSVSGVASIYVSLQGFISKT